MSSKGRVFSMWMGLKAIELNELIEGVHVDNPEEALRSSNIWE